MLARVRQTINRREVRESWQRLTKTDRVNVNEPERLISIIGGAALALYGLMRRSPAGVGAALAGGYFLYRGLTGHCPAYEAMKISTASRTERLQFKAGNKTSYQLDCQERPDNTLEPGSQLDESIWETFPASDPPAWTASGMGRFSS